MTDPLITIVVPCYNYAHYLAECIESVLAQTVSTWELIIVDDASTSGNPEAVVTQYPDPRIHFLRHAQNRGLPATRNTGIRHGNGALVLPMDGDDKLAPTYLEHTANRLADDLTLTAAFPDFYAFDAYDGMISYRLQDTRALLLNQWIPGPGTLFRRSLWEQVGGYYEELRTGNEDWDFWLSVAEQGLHVGHIAAPLYYYRQHANSLATRQRSVEHATREVVYHRHQALFDQFGLGGAFRAEGYRRSCHVAWRNREQWHAIRLAARGLRLAPAAFLRAELRPLYAAWHRQGR